MLNSAYIDEFQKYLITEKHSSKNTVSSYLSDVVQFVSYVDSHLGVSLELVSHEAVVKYVDWLKSSGKSNATISRS